MSAFDPAQGTLGSVERAVDVRLVVDGRDVHLAAGFIMIPSRISSTPNAYVALCVLLRECALRR